MFRVNNKDTRTSVSIVNFEHVMASWIIVKISLKISLLLKKYIIEQ